MKTAPILANILYSPLHPQVCVQRITSCPIITYIHWFVNNKMEENVYKNLHDYTS